MALSSTAERLAVVAYQRQMARLRASAAATAETAWRSLEGYDRADVATFARRAGPAVDAARQSAGTAKAGLVSMLTDAPLVGVDVPRLPAASFEEPFLRTWHLLGEGVPFDAAVESGAAEAGAFADGEVVSASRTAGDEADDGRVVAWERVPEPDACEWCQVVATQRYNTAESADFGHANCGCEVVPITGVSRGGRVIDPERLRELRQSGAVQRVSESRARARAR